MSTEKHFKKVLAASKSESILAVIEGLPVDANGYFMTEEQMTAVEDQLEANATAIASHENAVEGLNAQVTAAQTAQKSAEDALAAANTSITEKDARINELEAQVAKLEAGTPDPNQTNRDKDDTAGKNAGWENPMNKLADSLLGKPKPKKD
ncbi:MAG: hypothetical protein ACTHKV_03760 [Flavipsychrobacter sp.]